MDNIDANILKCLRENSRITVSEMAGKINLSIPAVSERLKKLDASGIIEKYTIILNAKKLGCQLTVFMFVSLENPRYFDKFKDLIQHEHEIIECYYLAGDFDYALKIITENTDTLQNILSKIKLISGIRKTKTVVTLSNIKNLYSVTLEDDY